MEEYSKGFDGQAFRENGLKGRKPPKATPEQRAVLVSRREFVLSAQKTNFVTVYGQKVRIKSQAPAGHTVAETNVG